jgi:hypothetical protein
MIVRVINLQTDAVQEFCGSPDEIRVDLITVFPWSTADDDPARGFLDVIVARISNAQFFDVEVEFEDQEDKEVPRSNTLD